MLWLLACSHHYGHYDVLFDCDDVMLFLIVALTPLSAAVTKPVIPAQRPTLSSALAGVSPSIHYPLYLCSL